VARIQTTGAEIRLTNTLVSPFSAGVILTFGGAEGTVTIDAQSLFWWNTAARTLQNGVFILLQDGNSNAETDQGISGASRTLDYTGANQLFQALNVSENTSLTVTPPDYAHHFQLKLTYGGAFTVAFTNIIFWENAAVFTPSTSADWDLIDFYWDGTNLSASFGTGGYSTPP
jgi:hypothetical protein